MAAATKSLRTLFCFGVLPAFFEAPADTRKLIFAALQQAYCDLQQRFGITVLGTMDDDRSMVGPSFDWPWTCYILADAPDHEAVWRFCNIVREVTIGDSPLYRYMKVETRVGRELFFGRS